MRVLQRICFVVLVSSLIAAQTSAPGGTEASQPQSEVNKPLNAIDAQQKAIMELQRQLTEQQIEIERLKQQLGQPHKISATNDGQSAHIVNATLTGPTTNPTAHPVSDVAPQERPKESPLSFRIGGADFTPGGFMDFTTMFRSTNTGNTGGTNFVAIPFSNTVGGHLTETRFTAQNSRISLKATDKFGENDVTGYLEMDFLGNDAANVEVTSNSHTLRQRLYWVDVKRHKWEILAGQSWSWLTPNRVGLSANPSDVFFSNNMDFNYQVGLTWTRAPQFRLAYHPNEHWGMGVALENPQQYVGVGEVTFPFAFNAQLGTQFDAGNNAGAPNMHPDVISKVAYDTDLGGKHFHAEAAGLLTSVKITDLSGGAFVSHTKTGAGAEAAVNLEVVKNLRFVANAFYSDGGGRYIFGMGPQAVVVPNAAGTDVDISMVHAGSGIVGFEAQVTPKTLFSAYYGGAYFQRNFFVDTTNPVPGRFAGFGGPNSPNSANRAIQEPSFAWTQTFWKSPQYGALQLITQASYVTRSPWFVAAGAPKNAHLGMGWVDLRYVLP
jgi:hypothetical protein